MRIAVSAPLLLALALALAIAAASGCATTADDPTLGLQNPDVFTRTEANGDVITEYRVAGQLQMVRITPARGPTYYLKPGAGPPDGAPVSPVYWKLFEWD